MNRRLSAVPLDYYGAGLMVLIGALAVKIGSGYSIGRLSRMGPGYFPVALGTLLILVGAGIAFAAWLEHAPAAMSGDKTASAEWRGWGCIAGSLVAFIVLGRYGGFLPATFVATFTAALADRENSARDAALLATAMSGVLIAVFWWALKMTFPLFAWGAS
ncbi:MAG: tripartite tricarboxylate transporter TctB family protein [Hyphomicrobiales bacterium]|nr:tripartite tricarboxylate transporter TctB family protein [Hyphomicrobiales bacterium]